MSRMYWGIGIVKFSATNVGLGWSVSGMIGDEEVIHDFFVKDPIERIMDWSSHRVLEISRDLHTSAVNFNPSDYL